MQGYRAPQSRCQFIRPLEIHAGAACGAFEMGYFQPMKKYCPDISPVYKKRNAPGRGSGAVSDWCVYSDRKDFLNKIKQSKR